MKKIKMQFIFHVAPLLLIFILIINFIHIQDLSKKLNSLQNNAMYYLFSSFNLIESNPKLNNLLKNSANSYYYTPIDLDKIVNKKYDQPMIDSAKKVIALSHGEIENIWEKKFITLHDIISFNNQIYLVKSDTKFDNSIEEANKLQILLFILLCLTSFINIIIYLRTEKEIQLERDFFLKAIEKAKSNRSV